MKFLDSNILIYAADETDLAKFDKACDIVDAAVRGNGFMIFRTGAERVRIGDVQVRKRGQSPFGFSIESPLKSKGTNPCITNQ